MASARDLEEGEVDEEIIMPTAASADDEDEVAVDFDVEAEYRALVEHADAKAANHHDEPTACKATEPAPSDAGAARTVADREEGELDSPSDAGSDTSPAKRPRTAAAPSAAAGSSAPAAGPATRPSYRGGSGLPPALSTGAPLARYGGKASTPGMQQGWWA